MKTIHPKNRPNVKYWVPVATLSGVVVGFGLLTTTFLLLYVGYIIERVKELVWERPPKNNNIKS